MATAYYYLTAGLPDLSMEEGRAFPSYKEFTDELIQKLDPCDGVYLRNLRYADDNCNFIRMLEHTPRPFKVNGNFNEAELEALIKDENSLPQYVAPFLEAFRNRKPLFDGLLWEDQLSWLYFDFMIASENRFVREWTLFELDLKNVIAGINCRGYNMKPEAHVIGNNDTADQIRKSKAPDFGLSAKLPWISKLIALPAEDLVGNEKKIDLMRWEKINELIAMNYFSIDNILAFTVKLGITGRWKMLSPPLGREMVERLRSEYRESYKAMLSIEEDKL